LRLRFSSPVRDNASAAVSRAMNSRGILCTPAGSLGLRLLSWWHSDGVA
jgi:hypothetical protein